MRKRNRLIAVLLVSAMTMALSACGGSAEGESKGESKGDGTLTVAIWDVGQQPGLEEIMADFTEKTGIKTSLPGYRVGQLLDAFGGGSVRWRDARRILDAFQ